MNLFAVTTLIANTFPPALLRSSRREYVDYFEALDGEGALAQSRAMAYNLGMPERFITLRSVVQVDRETLKPLVPVEAPLTHLD